MLNYDNSLDRVYLLNPLWPFPYLQSKLVSTFLIDYEKVYKKLCD